MSNFSLKVIEEFGGYDVAKKASEFGMIHNTVALKKHLLEYRRTHNIFEDGDKVVWICTKYLSNELMTWKFKDGFAHFGVRHATDKEIKQGFRDES